MPPRPPRPRCAVCRRRLTLAASLVSRCACGQAVCARCRSAHERDACEHDYRAAERDRLAAAMPAVAPPKVDRI